MAFVKRIALFMAVNILVVATISIVLSLLGVGPYLTQQGIDYPSLMAFCLVWGFGGAFISLALSRIMAKWMMGVKLVDASVKDPDLRWLVQTVHLHANRAGLSKMPEVGVFESADPNAFATGPTKSRSLVAVSTGLLQRMDKNEVEGVIAHEVAHVANGDMVTMTLIQGVVNAFVMFLARVAAFVISSNVKEENRRMVNMFTTIALEIVFGILGMLVVSAFSRHREFRADAGGAKLAGREKMVAALEKLQRTYSMVEPESHQSIAAFKISNKQSRMMALFSTHPPLEQRIAQLKGQRV